MRLTHARSHDLLDLGVTDEPSWAEPSWAASVPVAVVRCIALLDTLAGRIAVGDFLAAIRRGWRLFGFEKNLVEKGFGRYVLAGTDAGRP